MAEPLTVTATVIKIIGIITTVAKIIQSATSGYQSEFDRLMNELRALRNDVLQLGNTLKATIQANHRQVFLIELNRMYSLAESALVDLQTARLLPADVAQALRANTITNSGVAVTELTNAREFLDNRIEAIGQFLFVVTVRLEVLRELVPTFYGQEPYRGQIREWVAILRRDADLLENAIRYSDLGVRERRNEDCQYDPSIRRPICDLISITYTYVNRTGTVRFEQTYSGGDENIGRRQAELARGQGIQKDIELLGVPQLRETATAWEGLINVAAVQSLSLKFLERPLTAIETATLIERPDIGSINLRRLLGDLVQTDEFRTRFVEPMGDRMEEVADMCCRRLFDRSPDAEEAKLLGELSRRYGFNAMVAAMISSRQYDELFGDDLPRSDSSFTGTNASVRSDNPKLERRTIDVFRGQGS